MADETLISWADMTFNPWVGCTRVSPACDGCYAAHLMETRMGRVQWGGPGVGAGTRERTSAANWRKPLTWNKKAAAEGKRPFVFCSSLADVFDNEVPKEWRADLFDLIERTPNLIWLLLTKRPQNIVKLYQATHDVLPWPMNAAIGTTIEDQKRANVNVTALLDAKDRVRPAFAFLSCEPLLGPIDLTRIAGGYGHPTWRDALRGHSEGPPNGSVGSNGPRSFGLPAIDWVITGGETDQGAHKARPTHPDWFRSLRDQCADAGVPFHHKQNGESVHAGHPSITDPTENLPVDHSLGRLMVKVGKKRSGRMLDGVTHDAFPEARRA